MNISVIGNGAFASSLIQFGNEILAEQSKPGCVAPYPTTQPTCVVHAGSGRQLDEALTLCRKHGIPLTHASTGITGDHDIAGIGYVEAPNLSLPIVKFMHLLELAGPLFASAKVSISESHQTTKTTVPGTAVFYANALGVSPSQIRSIRDPKEQLALGIPQETLDAHAVHWIHCEEFGAAISFTSEVFGRKTYAHGMLEVGRWAQGLAPGRYHVKELCSTVAKA